MDSGLTLVDGHAYGQREIKRKSSSARFVNQIKFCNIVMKKRT